MFRSMVYNLLFIFAFSQQFPIFPHCEMAAFLLISSSSSFLHYNIPFVAIFRKLFQSIWFLFGVHLAFLSSKSKFKFPSGIKFKFHSEFQTNSNIDRNLNSNPDLNFSSVSHWAETLFFGPSPFPLGPTELARPTFLCLSLYPLCSASALSCVCRAQVSERNTML